MRKAVIAALCELANQDERIVLLTGDLGFMALEPFKEQFPDRFFNAGASEQNMIGTAVGLAHHGYVPYCYSIGTFAVLRALEFIRNGAVHNHTDIRILGVGAGFEYGTAGSSHHVLEDIAVLRHYGKLMICLPADSNHAAHMIAQTVNMHAPIYYRLSKEDTFHLGDLHYPPLGHTMLLRNGRDVVIFTHGTITQEVLEARDLLIQDNIRPAIILVTGFNPSPRQDVIDTIRQFGVILAVTVEAHYKIGGLGSFIAETIADYRLDVPLLRFGANSMQLPLSGSNRYHLEGHGLTAQQIASGIKEQLTSLTAEI
jgi:transketolase